MSKTVDIASKAEVSITGKKYCSSHQVYVDVQQGNIVTKTNSRRWICFPCQEKSKLLNKRAQVDVCGELVIMDIVIAHRD